ncbi:MAG: hypothetical protein EOR46_25050 [Mesorhizobium sp.]|nr:MAG: hypothetical protein EOR46_25050 [Mesorhizobium sp.]RWK61608.1 MAG: hypothetical protein EOR54_33075 [Mesorhizobium sp.]RWK90478.1 MAG: hypothetical protein EOR53_30610 [Mesorhizobium sp.]
MTSTWKARRRFCQGLRRHRLAEADPGRVQALFHDL